MSSAININDSGVNDIDINDIDINDININDVNLKNLNSITTSVKKCNFEEKEYFKEYHYYEKYNPHKKYETHPFSKNFGKGEHTYVNYLYDLHILDTDSGFYINNIISYVIAMELLSPEELKILAPYCQCQKCVAAWYNPMKYIACGCCIGCLKIEIPELVSQRNINLARIAILAE